MQDKYLFEYALIRFVPRVERGEFINVGVILYCKSQKYLRVKLNISTERIIALFPNADIEEVKSHLKSFEQICLGENTAGPIADMEIASRFRWLTAKRSTIFQASDVHPGLCTNPEETLEKLHNQLVI